VRKDEEEQRRRSYRGVRTVCITVDVDYDLRTENHSASTKMKLSDLLGDGLLEASYENISMIIEISLLHIGHCLFGCD
jgi:hypothetical protein